MRTYTQESETSPDAPPKLRRSVTLGGPIMRILQGAGSGVLLAAFFGAMDCLLTVIDFLMFTLSATRNFGSIFASLRNQGEEWCVQTSCVSAPSATSFPYSSNSTNSSNFTPIQSSTAPPPLPEETASSNSDEDFKLFTSELRYFLYQFVGFAFFIVIFAFVCEPCLKLYKRRAVEYERNETNGTNIDPNDIGGHRSQRADSDPNDIELDEVDVDVDVELPIRAYVTNIKLLYAWDFFDLYAFTLFGDAVILLTEEEYKVHVWTVFIFIYFVGCLIPVIHHSLRQSPRHYIVYAMMYDIVQGAVVGFFSELDTGILKEDAEVRWELKLIFCFTSIMDMFLIKGPAMFSCW